MNTFQMVGYYSKEGNLELRTTSNGLLRLADLLVSTEPSIKQPLAIPPNSRPDSYDGFLKALAIIKKGPLLEIRRNQD
ncbi:MAG: hypothetical protein ACRD9S_08835, partial [Pyrinomonadaceae bacterium]